MKIKDGFVLRQVMGKYVAVAVGEASKSFRGMIKLNTTAADIWQWIAEGLDEGEICAALCERYEVDEITAAADVRRTIEMLEKHGILEV